MRRARYVKGKKVGKGNMVNDVSSPMQPQQHTYMHRSLSLATAPDDLIHP